MDVRWWPVAAVGAVCFVAVVALAALLPMTAARRQLRPLANIVRLTRLPEYAKVARLRSLSTVVTLVVASIMFGAATWAAARPTGSSEGFDAAHPEDIMLCVGQSSTDPTSVDLLDYFARQVSTEFRTQRIGLTSVNRRVIPMTRDYQYVAARFDEYARADPAQATRFAPPVPYTDYATNVADVLALCISGFPAFEEPSTHRRSVIYLGPSDMRADDGQQVTLFTDSGVGELAARAGVQINVLDTAPSAASDVLRALTEQTGGRYVTSGATDAVLDETRAETPQARNADGTVVPADSWDKPALPLAIALVAAAVLSVALAVSRR